MATFTNFATLSYNGGATTSNTVTGEILETISATKTAVVDSYTSGDRITYIISLINSGTATVTGITLTDDLGAYDLEGTTLYPLSYTDGSVKYYINGVLQSAPTTAAGPPLVISGISVPANGSTIVAYEADLSSYAPLAADSTVTNNVTATGDSLPATIEATETVTALSSYDLSVSKALSPSVVTENGQLTYTFTIENRGNTEAVETDNIVLSDTFDPVLTSVSVTYNSAALAEGTGYTYDETTGVFSTLEGQITVPAATFTQNTDGTYTVVPGTATVTVTGTV